MRLLLTLLLLTLTPIIVSAQGIAGSHCVSVLSSFPCLAQGIGNMFGLGTAIIAAVALIYFFAGVVRKLWSSEVGNVKSLAALRFQLLWGFLAVFLILSIWGILSLLGNLFFGTNNFNSLF